MADRPIDDKSLDTLVVGLRLNALDEEFDPPPSPPIAHLERAALARAGAFFLLALDEGTRTPLHKWLRRDFVRSGRHSTILHGVEMLPG